MHACMHDREKFRQAGWILVVVVVVATREDSAKSKQEKDGAHVDVQDSSWSLLTAMKGKRANIIKRNQVIISFHFTNHRDKSTSLMLR